MKFILWAVRIALALPLIALTIAAGLTVFLGMAIGTWIAWHWNLDPSGAGGLLQLGGFAAQLICIPLAFGLTFLIGALLEPGNK